MVWEGLKQPTTFLPLCSTTCTLAALSAGSSATTLCGSAGKDTAEDCGDGASAASAEALWVAATDTTASATAVACGGAGAGATDEVEDDDVDGDVSASMTELMTELPVAGSIGATATGAAM